MILLELKKHLENLNNIILSNGKNCECDNSVGFQCALCNEKQLIQVAILEIERLQNKLNIYERYYNLTDNYYNGHTDNYPYSDE